MVKNLPTNTREARDAGSIPVLGRSPGVENDNPLQCSCPENSIHRGGWQATAPGVSESDPAEHAGHTPAVCPLVRTQRSPRCYAHPVTGGMVGNILLCFEKRQIMQLRHGKKEKGNRKVEQAYW